MINVSPVRKISVAGVECGAIFRTVTDELSTANATEIKDFITKSLKNRIRKEKEKIHDVFISPNKTDLEMIPMP